MSYTSKLQRIYKETSEISLAPEPARAPGLASVILRIVKLVVCIGVLATLLHKDSRQWSLLWIGGAVGYFTHPNPASKGRSDTVWSRVNLFWSIGPIVGLVISYPFFFDKMSFATVFVVGLILGGEVYVWLQTKKALNGG